MSKGLFESMYVPDLSAAVKKVSDKIAKEHPPEHISETAQKMYLKYIAPHVDKNNLN